MGLTRRKTAGINSVSPLGIFFLVAAFVLTGAVSSFGQENTPAIELAIVGDLDLYPILPDEGDDVVIGVLVANNGQKDARDVPVYFYEDSVYFDKVTVDIRAGDTAYVEGYWTAEPGDTYISVIVDPERLFPKNGSERRAGTWLTVR